MSQLHSHSTAILGGMVALVLIFAFLGWQKARATQKRLDNMLDEVRRRADAPTADEIARVVMRRMATQRPADSSHITNTHHEETPQDPYHRLSELASSVAAVGIARNANITAAPAPQDESASYQTTEAWTGQFRSANHDDPATNGRHWTGAASHQTGAPYRPDETTVLPFGAQSEVSGMRRKPVYSATPEHVRASETPMRQADPYREAGGDYGYHNGYRAYAEPAIA
jgi:hypothetical protein